MKLNPNTSDAYRLLHNGALAMGRAERQGIRVDVEYVRREKSRLSKEIVAKMKQLKNSTFYIEWEKAQGKEVNLNSVPQLSNYLYNVKGLEPYKTTETGQGSVDEEAITNLNIPELMDIIRIRKLKKIRDTYLDQFGREQVNGVIHPFFNLHLVRTYRSSSDSPNFQNIPKRDEEAMNIVRKALYPRPGHQLLEVDYGNLEVRIGACYHKDPNMIKYIKDPKTDMHRDMMAQIFKLEYDGSDEHKYLRSAAKNGFVFPQFYGDYYVNNAKDMACKWGELPNGVWKDDLGVSIGDITLGRHLREQGLKSIKSFEKHLEKIQYDFWDNRFPEYASWKQRWWEVYKRRGFVDMLTGFRCYGVLSRNDATNYPIQGSAFHCLLWSFIRIDDILSGNHYIPLQIPLRVWKSKLIGQIHDAIILDVHPDELQAVAEMVHIITTKELPKAWDWINVPLEVDAELCPVDGSWAEKEKYKLVA